MVQFEDDIRDRDRGYFARGERVNDRAGWFSGLRRLFGARREALIGILAVLFTATIGGLVIRDAVLATSKDKSGLRRIIANKWNDRTLAFPIDGTDSAGRYALFDVVVLTKDYGWVKGSTTELERGDTRLTAADIEAEVLAPQLRQGLGSAQELIAVGLASQEGHTDAEIQRGGLRAQRIAEWVRNAVDPSIPMSTLNLGQYSDLCSDCETDDTSWQRPFIVIAVRRADPETNIAEALRAALSDKENLPSPDRYSTFAIAKYRK